MGVEHDAISEDVAEYQKQQGALGVLVDEKFMGMKGERCDVFALFTGRKTVVVEVKISMADFNKDKGKMHVAGDVRACGDFRYYAAPYGLLETFDVEPRGYGLLEVHPDGSVTEALPAPPRHMVNRVVERELLALMIERMHHQTNVAKAKTDSPHGVLSRALELIHQYPNEWTTHAIKNEVGTRISAKKLAEELERTNKVEQDSLTRCWQPVVQAN